VPACRCAAADIARRRCGCGLLGELHNDRREITVHDAAQVERSEPARDLLQELKALLQLGEVSS
jgi:hypothetical protein